MNEIKVLVVDDDPMTCDLIAKILTLNGYLPAILTDSTLIIDVIQSQKPAVILLDYYLGSVDGLDVLKVIKAHQETMDVPVIVTSGIDQRAQSLEAGAQEFLLKPFDWDELISIINMLTAQSAPMAMGEENDDELENTIN